MKRRETGEVVEKERRKGGWRSRKGEKERNQRSEERR